MAIQKVLRLLLILPMLLMLTVASGQAQEPRPEQPLAGESPEAALGSAFTYQGLLNKDGSPANGTCDFTFSLWNAASGGSQVGPSVTKTSVAVAAGIFTVALDFGDAPFLTGEARWLQTAVRCPAGSGGYVTLAPRQPLTATPFALYSRGVWNFGATGTLNAGTPLGNGPGWTITAANGHRRDIVGGNPGVYIGASPGSGPANPQLTVSESGNVGVGVDVAAQRLHVVGNRIRLQNGGKILDLRADGTMVDVESTTSSIFISSIGAGHHVVVNPDAGDGNVGIGVSEPTVGKLQLFTTSGDAIRVTKGGDDGLQIGDGANFPNYGVYVPSPGTTYTALFVQTAQSSREWGLNTDDKIHAANVTLESVTLVAVVADGVELSSGDLVTAIGYVPSGFDETTPLASVTLAGDPLAGIVGVVTGRMELAPEPGKADEDPAPLVLHSAPGPARPGDYVAVAIAGVAQVKADATAGPISAGQRLTSATAPGHARTLQSKTLDGMLVAEGAPVVGLALESLNAGQGLIWVLVNPQ